MSLVRTIIPVVVVCVGCAGAPSAIPESPSPLAPLPSVALPAPLDRVLRDYETAWRAEDETALATLFTEDGFVLSGGRPPIRGRDRIEARYADSGGPLVLRALAYEIEGSIAYIVGAYAREAGEPDIGKFTLTLRRGDDGTWRIFSDMDNGNTRR